MSKRRSTRSAQVQSQPQPTHSDYDTDQPNTTNMMSAAPPVQRTNDELNLKGLRQSHDPSVAAIVHQAPFAVIYKFSPDSQGWARLEVEGTLFVCIHAPTPTTVLPRFSIAILNRKRLDTFSVELSRVAHVENSDQYIIVNVDGDEQKGPESYGIWIFNEEEGNPMQNTKDVMFGYLQACVQMGRPKEEEDDIEENHGQGMGEVAEEYGMDGTTQMQQQMEEEETVAQHAEQRLDLLQLFGNNANNANNGNNPPAQNGHPTLASPMQTPGHPMHFASPGVSNGFSTMTQQSYQGAPPVQSFFQAMAPQQTPQYRQPSQHQNALLGLFKSGS